MCKNMNEKKINFFVHDKKILLFLQPKKEVIITIKILKT